MGTQKRSNVQPWNRDWTWAVPWQLAVLVEVIADRHGFAWEQVACMCLTNGLADTIAHHPDVVLIDAMQQAIQEMKDGPLRDFNLVRETYEVRETVGLDGHDNSPL